MSYCVVIRGPLGVGKTTIADRLADRLGGRSISIDRILKEHRLEAWDEDRISLGSFLRANDHAIREARTLLKRGMPAVIEGNFYWKEAIDDLVRRLACPCFVRTLSAPLELCIERDRQRPKTHPGRDPRAGDSLGAEAAKEVYRMVAAVAAGRRVDARGPVETVVGRLRGSLPPHRTPTTREASEAVGGRSAIGPPGRAVPSGPIPARARRETMRLEPMSANEVRSSIARGIVRSARENVARGLWARRVALTTSRKEYAELLPRGGATAGFSFVKIMDGQRGKRVGEAWFSVAAKGGRTHFWIHWLFVEPRYRRRGYARFVLREMAARARAAGADRLGLHVLADNTPARALYARMGFVPTSLRVARMLESPRSRRVPRAPRPSPRSPSAVPERRKARRRLPGRETAPRSSSELG